jgi:hypothetical protein
MATSVRRGYSPDDERNFTGAGLMTLGRAARDLRGLLDRGYPAHSASVFVGDHYLLSARQRTALTRVTAATADIAAREAKRLLPEAVAGETVHIDGFNAVITLEVALSGSPVLACMDGAFRDLAGLRGTYRLIDKTDAAIRLIAARLKSLAVSRAVFFLDAPVSNSGRLKCRIAEIAEQAGLPVGIELAPNVDAVLYDHPNVISGDSVILDRCPSWLNLLAGIIPALPGVWVVRAPDL